MRSSKSWLKMPEKLYEEFSASASRIPLRPEEVLVRVVRVLESVYHVTSVVGEVSEAFVDGLVPIWFTVPEEFGATREACRKDKERGGAIAHRRVGPLDRPERIYADPITFKPIIVGGFSAPRGQPAAVPTLEV